MKRIAASFIAALLCTAGYIAANDEYQDTPDHSAVIDAQGDCYLFPVYGWDSPDAMREEIGFYLPIQKQASIEEQLQALCDGLSRFLYGRLPIEIIAVEEREPGLVAIIELRESEYAHESWATGFFQGSIAMLVTQNTLVRTLLQPKYRGDWIDALVFHYEGEPIPEGIWDHHNLHKTFVRSDYS